MRGDGVNVLTSEQGVGRIHGIIGTIEASRISIPSGIIFVDYNSVQAVGSRRGSNRRSKVSMRIGAKEERRRESGIEENGENERE